MTKKIGSAHHSSVKKPKPVLSDTTPPLARAKETSYLQRPGASNKQPVTKTFAQRRTTPK